MYEYILMSIVNDEKHRLLLYFPDLSWLECCELCGCNSKLSARSSSKTFSSTCSLYHFICTCRLWDSKNWPIPKHMHKASEILHDFTSPYEHGLLNRSKKCMESESLSWLRWGALQLRWNIQKHSLQHDKNPQRKQAREHLAPSWAKG